MPAAQFENLFIAEKSSLAQAIAEARAEELGVPAVKAEGGWQVGRDRIASLAGHVYTTAEPGAYDKKWEQRSIENLPIEIDWDNWKRIVVPEKPAVDGRKYESPASRVKRINRLMKESSNFVNCGDAAREGQLLVDEVIEENGFDPFAKNVRRLWVNSMAKKDMLAALANMKPNIEKQSLFHAALCRQRADFLHGMNLSRLYTGLARLSGVNASIDVGRVMTPTLRLVVDRDREIIYFKPVKYFIPKIEFQHPNGNFTATWIVPADYDGLDSEGRLIDRAVAQALCERIAGKTGKIASYKSENKSISAPLPYSLSALQADCSQKVGLTAQETLNVAQKLYETHKIATYPRTDSRHLKLALLPEAPTIMKALAGTDDFGELAKNTDLKLRSGAWDDSKTSDHHGIMPTTDFTPAKLEKLDDVERKVFALIAKTFIAQFYPSYRYRSLIAEISCDGERFKATGKQVIDQGWRVVYGAVADDETEGDEVKQTLPAMQQNDSVKAGDGSMGEDVTKPPSHFTDGTLITAMANVHRFETDPEVKKRLKETDGIGTEATRAQTLEKLIRIKMLERKGKTSLRSTEFGRSVIDALPSSITGAGLTALWETALNEVEKGKLDPKLFLQKQASVLADHIENAKGNKITVKGVKPSVRPIRGDGETCKKCGKGVMTTIEYVGKKDKLKHKVLMCTNRPECSNFIHPDQPQVAPLPGDGTECPLCHQGVLKTRPYKSKTGEIKSILSCSRYPECKQVGDRLPPTSIKGDGETCPECKKGHMQTKEYKDKQTGEYKNYLRCDNMECKHPIFPDSASRAPRPKVEPLPGDGQECTKCHRGKMTTIGYTDKKDGSAKSFLKCTMAPKCTHVIWPNTKKTNE